MIPIQVNRDDHLATFNNKSIEVRKACREWLGMSFSVDSIDMMMMDSMYTSEEFLKPETVFAPYIPIEDVSIIEDT